MKKSKVFIISFGLSALILSLLTWWETRPVGMLFLHAQQQSTTPALYDRSGHRLLVSRP